MFFVGLDLAVARASAYAVLNTAMQCSLGWWDYQEEGAGIIPTVVDDCPFILAIDGPQGWARSARSQRLCEECLNTPGRAPYDRNPRFAREYIEKSAGLFTRLTKQEGFRLLGLDGILPHSATLIEVYPGRAWRVLANNESLAKKNTAKGLDARRKLLEKRGVTFPVGCAPNHDQMDAALAAWIAHELHGDAGNVRLVGEKPCFDGTAGCLREGYIVEPVPPAHAAPRPRFKVNSRRLGWAAGVNQLKLNQLANISG